MPKFRKKPVEIEAIRYTGCNQQEIEKFCSGVTGEIGSPCIFIPTLEGEMRAGPGDWIIRGVKGEFYPCKADIFAATYDAVEVSR